MLDRPTRKAPECSVEIGGAAVRADGVVVERGREPEPGVFPPDPLPRLGPVLELLALGFAPGGCLIVGFAAVAAARFPLLPLSPQPAASSTTAARMGRPSSRRSVCLLTVISLLWNKYAQVSSESASRKGSGRG